ncbi:hypothetical protein CGCA056_v013747 [Colletotrichum aenigma]|uniref:uncharacterized protein n=1 Tax=Colletotrichum aenigma TaxID=1215731 RepID=UPI0018729295|nr:uncharacterized protein CGCA056_v013747 [Colletotrichum aenigma]KAF5507869.1 hypothetical protein CGCA056_v013747 [Colletotrichum aenigma]
MDAGGLAQMNSNNFSSANGLAMPGGGLASRRGGPVKPLSLSNATPASNADNGAPTPRTSRSHLLAGLRTAPKSSTATNFPAGVNNNAPSPTTQSFARNATANSMQAQAQNSYNGPKTALPRYGQHQQQAQQQAQQLQAQQFLQQQQQQQQKQQQQQAYANQQQYTTEQVLAPPEIVIDDQEQMDPSLYAQLVATNMYLAQQQQRLQQQLLSVQAAAQQFQGLNLQGAQQQIQQQQLAMYQQQQQLQSLQQSMLSGMAAQQQPQVYTYYDPVTRQQGYYVDQGQNDQQAQLAQVYAALQQQQQLQIQQLQQQQAPRVQVSPPPENHATPFRTATPPKRYESPSEVTPLPPPSANAFRRGHKKVMSLALNGNNQAALSPSQEPPKSAGPKTASFPLTPLSGGYGPGQGRAGEHPVRQPRGPPSIEELKAKPTAKHEGSKNFATRTRRSAVHNLVRAGRERRKGTGSSSGSMSPVSESAEEESGTPITDNESDSGHSGSGSLAGDIDCSLPSSRTSTNGSWGAIGSDRPSSRQRARKSVDSVSSAESGENSFASVFKNSAQRAGIEVTDGQRKAPMLVLTSAEKRKSGILA